MSAVLDITPSDIERLSRAEKLRALELLQERKRRDALPINTYRPYSQQQAFHSAGATYRERLLRAGNQLGKSFAGGMEMAYHLTGLYPDWWQGRRFKKAVRVWASSDTAETTRDNPQRVLFGPVGDEWGNGTVPHWLIKDSKPAPGAVAGLVDYVTVKHSSGSLSTVRFKYYAQGRAKWQGPSLDAIWCDEEPPAEIYDEALARTIATGGMIYTTFTPLLGMSDIVRRFLMEDSGSRSDVNMVIEDAEHISPEKRQEIIDSFPAHEREARARGVPILGSGRIYQVADSTISFEPFDYPKHWACIGGLDFGWDHPTAGVMLRWDRDADVVYVTAAYRVRQEIPSVHAGTLKGWSSYLKWAWPHDGLQTDKQSGQQIANVYRNLGLKLLPDRAQFEDGSIGVEAGITEMLERMRSGRLKVATHLHDWWEEFRLYHRKDGKIVKSCDDLMDGTRYALMCLSQAAPIRSHEASKEYGRKARKAGWRVV